MGACGPFGEFLTRPRARVRVPAGDRGAGRDLVGHFTSSRGGAGQPGGEEPRVVISRGRLARARAGTRGIPRMAGGAARGRLAPPDHGGLTHARHASACVRETRTHTRRALGPRPLAAQSQGEVVVPYRSREHARAPRGCTAYPHAHTPAQAPSEPRTGGYPVDPAGSIRLPQRLSHACPVQASTAKLRTAHYTSGNVRGGPC